jgi:hypothetical protein
MAEKSKSKSTLLFGLVIFLLVAIRVWLVWGMPKMILYAPHDDLYFAKAAHYIVSGEWMGPYSEMTLIKAPFYSFFIIASSFTGLSLFVSETLFYIGACLIAFFALRPFLKNSLLRLLVLAFLIYAPVAMPAEWNVRVYREFVYLSLNLYVVAFGVGFLSRLKGAQRNQIWWGIGLGLSTGAFLITREDGVWIYPALIILILCALILIWAWKLDHKVNRSLLVVVPVVLAALPTIVVSGLNQSHYGFWGVSEQLDPEFQRVQRDLARIQVEDAKWSPDIKITRAQRFAAYHASPLFGELQTSLEKTINWFIDGSTSGQQAKPYWYKDEFGVDPLEIGNSHFPWALRMAVGMDGYYSDATKARSFYQQVADQLEAACANGQLKCTSANGLPLVGSIDQRQVPLIVRIAFEGANSILKSRNIRIFSIDFSTWEPWPGNKDDYIYFDEFINNPVNVRLLQANPDTSWKYGGNTFDLRLLPYQHKILAKIAQIYKPLSFPLMIFGVVAWIYIGISAFHKKEHTVILLAFVSTFEFGLFLSRLITLAIVDATTTIPGMAYGSSILLFAFLFLATTIPWAVQDLVHRISPRQAIRR